MFSDDIFNNRILRELSNTLHSRKRTAARELEHEQDILKDVEVLLTELHQEIPNLKQEVDILRSNPEARARDVLPQFERLASLEIRADSLVAVREHAKANIKRLKQDLEDINEQSSILSKLLPT